jgi:WD40 repeat protein
VLVAGAGEINRRTFPRVHRSFSDFVTSAGAEDFRVDTTDSDGELAIQCMRQLSQLWANVEQGLQEIPAQLPYAISHWSSHLTRMVGVKMEQVERDDESISTPDAIDIVSDPDSAQVGVEVKKRTGGSGDLWCITFSPDGTCMAITQDESIRSRNIQTGEEVSLLGHTESVYFVAFSPDGKRIVSASWDKTIRIWNSDTGEMVLGPLEDHTNTVNSAVFSPDGRLIVSTSNDQTIRVWDSQSGAMVLGPLKGHISGVEFAVFSADARRIMSYSDDGAILIWDCDTGEMVLGSHESDDAKLSFTDSETAPYIITPPHSNIPAAGTSASYLFSLDDGVVAGVVCDDVDTWLYCTNHVLMSRYTGQLILTWY